MCLFILAIKLESILVSKLPVIVGFGGINPAGRGSFHHAYNRLVLDALGEQASERTLQGLASLMGLEDANAHASQILDGTLIRKIEPEIFDTTAIDFNHSLKIQAAENTDNQFVVAAKNLPDPLPEGWSVQALEDKKVLVRIADEQRILVPTFKHSKVQSAGQLPSGFTPGSLYQSRNHPRGLQMTIFGASDALGSLGIPWEDIARRVPVDQVSVYAGSGMSQLDANANGGMMAARFNGKRVTSKQCPFGFAEMPADFINAYVLGSLGTTGTNMGACASFLYNLRQGISDIQSGKSRVVLVGNSEAPITPEIIEGYSAMGALATDRELKALDGSDTVDHRRACRPFGNNCGFTLAESAQFVLLFDDDLAIEMGAQVHGAITDIFVNADGYKKSISAPGVGNYLTVAKALASARSLLGEDSVRHRSFVQAHGTGTPQNRVTESHILDEVARVFGIDSWPVVAVKSYLGHSISVAGGDQLISTLGIWSGGILPGIKSIDGPADDVHCDNLAINNKHSDVGPEAMDSAVINAKGFGGNNASATVIAPHIVKDMLKNKHGKAAWTSYQAVAEKVAASAQAYDDSMLRGDANPVYKFDHNVLSGDELDFNSQRIAIEGYASPVSLDMESPYRDWLK